MNIEFLSISHVRYTIAHRKAFRAMERKLFGAVSISGYLHDLDKVILYPILGKENTSSLHKRWSKHHNRANTYKDYCQMVVDWECCRFTKPDKQLGRRCY